MLVCFVVIIVLININSENLSINSAYPLTIKINKEKLEDISMSIILDQEIEDRKKAEISLQYQNHTILYKAGKDQDKYNERKIEFIINPNDFINHYGKYILYFNLSGEIIVFNQTIFIYNNDIILKNPKNKYELTETNINTRIIKYEFQNEIFFEEINRIIYYSLSDSNNKYYLENYSIEDGTKLIIKFPGTSQVTTYVFDIYPEYDKDSSNSEIHRFYLHFHNYLLKNDAIYINKGISNSNTVSFKTLLKQYYNNSPFIITDSNKNINCDKFSCNKNNNDNYYLCECSLNFELKLTPNIINILYENNQLRELYLILYTSYMDKCYEKDENKNLEILMEWVEEMEYDHYLYFNDTSQKILTTNYLGKTNKVISYKYYISTLSLSSGILTLRSSIPSLNYTDYNLVDDKNLYIYIYPKKQLVNKTNAFIYSHNDSKQIINLTFNEPGEAKLDEIILKKNENTIIKVSKTEGQCTIDDTSFICDLKDIIYNYDDDKNGNYYIYYKSGCGKEFEIKRIIVTLKKGIILESISPSWISKSIVNGYNLTLEYNDNMENKNLIIFLYTNDRNVVSLPYYPISVKNKNVIITLRNMNKGLYHIYTIINNGENKLYEDNLSFKISEQIKFEFNHHYFVLNNGGKEKNNLIIKVNDDIEEFGCKIIEDSSNSDLKDNSCLEFIYPISKLGTIKFSYYDNDTIKIPINDNITVVQYYTQLFIFNSLKNCYYHSFDISINFIDLYKNKFKLLIFLKSNDNTMFNLTNENEYIYSLVSKNDNLINKNYYLYFYENKYDQVFLYKYENSIQFTDITVPEFIMEPNTTIIFSNIKCDLSNSKFIMKKYDEENLEDKTLTSCKYNSNDNKLSCSILEAFYRNNLYRYFYYQVDDKNISKINTPETIFLTFASKKLNEAPFNFNYNKEGNTEFSITLENSDKYFYFPLLKSLNYTMYNEEKGKNQTYTINRGEEGFIINNEEGKVEFNITIELNSILYINFLYREEKEWETISDKSTLYHYFPNFIDNKLFDIKPNIYAYNNIKGREFPVTISFYQEPLNEIIYINLQDCIKEENKKDNIKCINNSKINFGNSQNYSISIGKGNDLASKIIKLIYYKLIISDLEQCLNNIKNLILQIDTPDNLLSNKIKLETDIINKKTSLNNIIYYNLTITDISQQYKTLKLKINDENFNEEFTLNELGLNIIPTYNIYLENNEKYIYLLPEKNQKVKVYLSTENNENINYDDKLEFKIINGNVKYTIEKEKINDNSLNLIFNNFDSNINYTLYFIDKCGNSINTHIIVVFITFEIKRKYFVLNNNLDMDKQYLIIEGPNTNSLYIIAYKDNKYYSIMNYDSSRKYYIELDKNSKGDYSFKYSFNGIEKDLEGIVYVRENLNDFFMIEKEPSNCLFLDENKNALTSLNYTISSNNEVIKSIETFKSIFKINETLIYNLSVTNLETKKETFVLNYSNDMKKNINTNKEYYIYLTENYDIDQPIYVFKYNYTNIYLNSEFSELIYTDADYISFNMSCIIYNIQPFYLVNSNNNKYKIICEESSSNNYDDKNKIYKCSLSYNDKKKNELLKFGNEILEYGYYDIYYTNSYKITNKKFFLSNEIKNIDFIIEKEEDIFPGQNTTVTIYMGNKIFYSPNTESIKYGISTIYSTLYNANFNYIFEDDNNNNFNSYLTCSINIIKGIHYGIKEICRKSCSYCRNSDCKDINTNYDIISNSPYVTFDFDKHYIALNNSTDSEKFNISSLIINKNGDVNEIDYIIYNRETEDKKHNEQIVYPVGNIYTINDLEVGKYTFKYHVIGGKNISIINDVVLVVENDYEMFNYTELKKKCLYYKINKGILVSITKNSTYKFKDNVIESVMEIYLNDFEFPYDKENGYQIISENIQSFNENYKGNNFILKLREKNAEKRFTFTTISNDVTITAFDLNSEEGFFYKDNIVLKNQYCLLDNIFILSQSNQNEPYSLLKCQYYDINKRIYYYDIHYSFKSSKSDNFGIYIGNKRENKESSNYFYTGLIQLIYNSIKDSDFIVNYNEPIISITSSNFDLSLINKIKIDNEFISKERFLTISDNSISYNYYKNNTIDNYLKELVRNDHSLDRENITIKNKTINLKIEKTECPEFYVNHDGLCLSCSQIASSPGQDKTKIWYQNGVCVNKCSGDYAIYDEENFYCFNCSEKTTDLNNKTICGCLVGTVKSDIDGVCYLPEDERIKRLLLIRPNSQCYRVDGKTHNYCNNNNTENCEIKSYSGYSFPYCKCKSGYTGKYCEFEDNNIDLNGNMDTILNGAKNNKINEASAVIISKIRGIIFFLEKNDSNIQKINNNQIELYITLTYNSINSTLLNNTPISMQIYDVIELAVFFLYYKINNSNQRIRNLEEYNDTLQYIIENAHYANYMANKGITYNYNIQTDGLNLISFICYKKNAIDSGFKSFIKNTTYKSNITGYINLTNSIVDDNELLILTILNKKLFLNESEQSNGVIINFSTNNENTNLSNLTNFHAYIYSSDIKVNYDLAYYYQTKNINIYYERDDCFINSCYISENFEYDLTQKFRKKNVFQKLIVESEYCNYNSFEMDSNSIEIKCDQFKIPPKSQVNNKSYVTLNLTMKDYLLKDQDEVHILPLICPKGIKIEKNYGFWFFLIICIIEIFYICGINILTLGSLRRVSIRKGLVNDELYFIIPRVSIEEENDNNSNDESIKKKIKYKRKNNQKIIIKNSLEELNTQNEEYFNKTLIDCIIANFKELHPLPSLCRVSIISPLILHSWFFIFNLLCLFGFNALIYYEGLIEKRIYDKKRNNFDYPMRKEFHKIILSILCQIALTTLLKFLVMVTLPQRDNLEYSLKSCKLKGNEEINNEIVTRIDQFEKKMLLRRLLGGILMIIIVTFFFYYTVVFCGIYINTQRNWMFSCVWSLFWNWIIFCPIYIVIISFIEHKKQDSYNPLVYNLKRLFFF